jgi:predicted ATPase
MPENKLIRELVLENFLSYGSEGEKIVLEPLNVLIGPNASGKSNLLEAIALLSATPRDFKVPIRQGGGINEWLWKGTSNPTAKIEAIVSYPAGKWPLRYRIDFAQVGQKLEMTDEVVESALSQVPEAIVVCERDESGSHLRRLQADKLKSWLERYSLGDLWQMGELGGTRW